MKKYDDLNQNEKEILEIIRNFRLSKDHAILSLYSFKINDLIEDYNQLIDLRKTIQMKYFDIYDEIYNLNFVDNELNKNQWAYNLENEENLWTDELNTLYALKNNIEESIELIESGKAKEMIIDEENR